MKFKEYFKKVNELAKSKNQSIPVARIDIEACYNENMSVEDCCRKCLYDTYFSEPFH